MTDDRFAQSTRRRLHLKPGRERAVRNRHPWIFDGAILKEEGEPDAAVADLIGTDGTLAASGFYSRRSQIRMRALTFGETFDVAWLRSRIEGAIAARKTVIDERTSCARLINSEGDGLSGLVVDRYADVLVAEISSAGLEAVLDEVVGFVVDASSSFGPVSRVIFNNEIPARRLEGLSLEPRSIDVAGDAAREVIVLENGLRFFVTPGKGQKTGFFIDQRDNRRLAREIAAGRNVLNVFAYTGGFGVNAAAGGATTVEEVDISSRAIAVARRNHELNESTCEVTFTVGDAFARIRELGEAERRFGLVVVDPPAFAKSKKDVEHASRGYKDVIMNGLRLVEPGGMMMAFSCSGHVSADLFQKIVFGAAIDARREVSLLRRLGSGADHPVSIYCPEGEYLKGFLLAVR